MSVVTRVDRVKGTGGTGKGHRVVGVVLVVLGPDDSGLNGKSCLKNHGVSR